MKTIIIIGITILILGAAAYGGFQYLLAKSSELPNKTPLQCQSFNTNNKKVVVALGDSITHAKVSGDYLKILSNNDSNSSFNFINAGINSRLAYNAYQVIDSVIACQPSVVTILIGTNDVLATRSKETAQYYINKWGLPQTPDFKFFQDNLTNIIEKLQSKTKAKIAVFSLPPMGEELNSAMNKTVEKYNDFIKEAANEYDISYLPLNEMMWQILKKQGNTDKACLMTDKLMEKSIAKHYLLNKSWDEISAQHGLQLLTDCVHLNDRGAQMVADLVQEFLSE